MGTVFTSPFHKVDIENLVLVVIRKNSVKIYFKKIKMPKEFHEFDMTKPPGASWWIRIGGGVDRGKVLVLEKIIFNTIAYETGLKERDFIVEINGTQVFDMDHDVCKDLIKQAGDTIKIKIERGDHIVPNMDEAFPKKSKTEDTIIKSGNKPYWVQALEEGKGARNKVGFTTCGKPKMAQKQYNSPMTMYSEEVLEEIRRSGTIGGKPVNMDNLMNPTGKDFEPEESEILALIKERE